MKPDVSALMRKINHKGTFAAIRNEARQLAALGYKGLNFAPRRRGQKMRELLRQARTQ